ncbi:hypothetical protein BKA56DRAFT_495475, partial [Ilyonectria sp. MPI-CAGE-AT-0026]
DTTAPTEPGPDIEWIPSYETYRERVKRLAAERNNKPLDASLPDGFPKAVGGCRVWARDELCEDDYFVHLDEADVGEIVQALEEFISDFPATDPNDVTTDTFRLPNLGKKLDHVSQAVHSGRGLVCLRGLDPDKFTRVENVLLYVGICRHVGSHFGIQDSDGSYLIHVKDIGRQVPASESRQAPFANMAQPFHSDSSDVVAMYALGKAHDGGASCFASTGQIYNEIVKSRSDVILTLAADDWWMVSSRPRGRGGRSYWYRRPLLFNFPEHGPGLYVIRRVLTGSPVSPRTPGVPPMSEEQAEALDMVHFTAERNQLRLTLEPGDVLFVNNFAVLHARDKYEDQHGNDAPGESQRDVTRHLMRLWPRDEKRAWETPSELAASWFDTYGPSPRRWRAKWTFEVPLNYARIFARENSCS